MTDVCDATSQTIICPDVPMKHSNFAACRLAGVLIFSLTGCGVNFSQHEQRLEDSGARDAVIAAGQPSVLDANLTVFADADVELTMGLLRRQQHFQRTRPMPHDSSACITGALPCR